MSDRLADALAELAAAIREEVRAELATRQVQPDRLLSVDEAAAALGIGRSLTYDLISSGRLRSVRVNRRRLIPSSALAEYAGTGGGPGMTAKLDKALIGYDMLEDPRLIDLPRGVRLLHIEAACWSALHKTNGAISRGGLRRLSDEPNAGLAAAQLVTAGVWASTDNGWQIVDFMRDQMAAEKVSRIREANKERLERWQQCRLGDHSGCKHNGVRNGVSTGVSNGRRYDSTRREAPPTVERRVEEGGAGLRVGDAPATPPMNSERAQSILNDPDSAPSLRDGATAYLTLKGTFGQPSHLRVDSGLSRIDGQHSKA